MAVIQTWGTAGSTVLITHKSLHSCTRIVFHLKRKKKDLELCVLNNQFTTVKTLFSSNHKPNTWKIEPERAPMPVQFLTNGLLLWIEVTFADMEVGCSWINRKLQHMRFYSFRSTLNSRLFLCKAEFSHSAACSRPTITSVKKAAHAEKFVHFKTKFLL